MTSQETLASEITMDELARVSRTRVFFGHQSVGMDVMSGIPAVYAAHQAAPPSIEQGRRQRGADGGFVAHAFIGENEKPLLKIRDFGAQLGSGIAQQVDVAMMKFCYVDITINTDVGALFAAYHESIGALERDFPWVAFVHVTVPLMARQRPLSMMKSRLVNSSRYGPPDNAARERLNALIRREYAHGHLFDLASAESTTPDGSRVVGTYQGQRYYRLYDGYARDPGHLNDEGARVAATAWLKTIAQASAR
jgi:hypothetical protein